MAPRHPQHSRPKWKHSTVHSASQNDGLTSTPEQADDPVVWRSFTTYELAQQMDRTVSWFWPVAKDVGVSCSFDIRLTILRFGLF